MSKISYIVKAFRESTLAIIEQANEIIDEYLLDDLQLTIRQLYYQFVSMGEKYMIELGFPIVDGTPHNPRSYAKLGGIINRGRLAGLIDWRAIEDRTRNLIGNTHWKNPGQIIQACASSFQLDRWMGQKYRVEIWIEKDALSGVIENICRSLDVSFFACKGYVSQSEMWASAQRLAWYKSKGQTPVIIHLGDHDPSGIDMTRDIEDRQSLFQANTEVVRIALNIEQIEKYNPPPFYAKAKDPRSTGYIPKYGDTCWELDALEPKTMRNLIRDTVLEYRDEKIYQQVLKQEQEYISTLENIEKNWKTL